MVSLQEFYDMLEKHDWFWFFADNFEDYQEGQLQEGILMQIAGTSEAHGKLMKEYNLYIHSGPAWNTAKSSKPLRPL